jgi:hypothetical protein
MNGAYCDDKVINEKMTHAIKVAKTVDFNSDSYVYLNKIYNKLADVMRGNSSFMENLECFSIFKMFKALLTGLRKYEAEDNIPLDEITSGDILLIKCPSIFASYHFIIAVVNPAKTEVSVFQSYGSYKKLHKIVLTYSEFKKLLGELETFKSADFDSTYKMMINVEEKLYGIDEREYIARLQEAQPPVNNENLFSNMTPNSHIERAEKLNIPPDIYENLEHNFNINQSKLAVTAYRVATKDADAEGIKTKKKKTKKEKRKTKKRKTKKSNSKKSKTKSKKSKRKTIKSNSKKSKSKK